MQRSDFLNGVSAIVAAVPLMAQAPLPASVAGIVLPDSALAHEASQMARAAEPAPIFNHSNCARAMDFRCRNCGGEQVARPRRG